MVYPSSYQRAYSAQKAKADLLKEEFRQLMTAAPEEWHVVSRVKEKDSFYEKLETGRVDDPNELEDFFAATIVVPLSGDIGAAVRFVKRFFTIQYRRPYTSSKTHRKSSDFPFDDLRLYGHLKVRESSPVRPIDEITFEIQIKTFFQHAWSVTTHSAIYKHDIVSWRRARVAHQVKALLEHAEYSLDSIDALEGNAPTQITGEPEQAELETVDYLIEAWDRADLPTNLRRAAQNILNVAQACGLKSPVGTLKRGATSHGGHPEGWSPYQCLVYYLAELHPDELTRALIDTRKRASVIWVNEDILRILKISLAEAGRARI